MRKVMPFRAATAVLILVGSVGMFIDRGSSVHADHGGPTVTIGGPIPLPVSVSNTPLKVAVKNFPAVQDVRVTNPVLPVALQRTVVHDGQFFNLTQPDAPPFLPAVALSVPADVVLTDVHVTFSVPESVPNAAALVVDNGSRNLVYQIVNNTTFNAGVDLQSGILSTGALTVALSCYNIAGNHCQGALMWSGYTTP
jgi:hypothetical protein